MSAPLSSAERRLVIVALGCATAFLLGVALALFAVYLERGA